MSSSISQSTDEQPPAFAKGLQSAMESTPQPRRVLGDVSPNVKAAPSSNKPMMGSPLKRSFTAMAEQGSGFRFLKKRKGSDENTLGLSAAAEKTKQPHSSPRRVFKNIPMSETSALGSNPEDAQTDDNPIPHVQETSPTEPNTPSSLNEDDHENTQSSSLDRKSFSSLINYEPSSQTRPSSDALDPSPSRAEMLRLRLRVAMYKVRTNQIDVPFAQLPSPGGPPPPQQQPARSATSLAVEEAVAQLRREAQQDLARRQQNAPPQPSPPRALRLLPAPVLRPTAYSSRMIYEPHAPPSSPPVIDRTSGTPQAQRSVALDPDLTSSVVKGRVAEGLLGLRNAA
nr:hypothetical protein CFP56_42111 [Quercus suber]